MSDVRPADLAQESVETVRRWLDSSSGARVAPQAKRLAGVLGDPDGLDFTLGFVDRVVRPEDLHVAAASLEELSRTIPKFLPWFLRAAIATGGGLATGAPRSVVPVARRALRKMVEHLIVDATPHRLGASLAKLRADGSRLNLNLLGEAVLGDAESDRRLEGTRALLAARRRRLRLDQGVGGRQPALAVGVRGHSDRLVERLTPLYELAASSATTKFINLDMEEYHDLDLTLAVFTRILDQPPEMPASRRGSCFRPTCLIRSARCSELSRWSTGALTRGGAPDQGADRQGGKPRRWNASTPSPRLAAGHLVDRRRGRHQLQAHARRGAPPEQRRAVRVGVAGHNLFDVACALAPRESERGHERSTRDAARHGARRRPRPCGADAGGLLLYTPVVHPPSSTRRSAYLVRRLEENAGPENFLSAAFEIGPIPTVFEREKSRFLASLTAKDDLVIAGDERPGHDARRIVRGFDLPPRAGGFANEPDTDLRSRQSRRWARGSCSRSRDQRARRRARSRRARIDDVAALESIVAGVSRGRREVADREDGAARAGLHRRGRRLRTLVLVARRPARGDGQRERQDHPEGDPEVSEAIDFARYYAVVADELERDHGARSVPPGLIVVSLRGTSRSSIPVGGVRRRARGRAAA